MTMGWETGRARIGGCSICGRSVRQREVRLSSGDLHWIREEHVAPCGAACIGGGARRPRESHGYLGRCSRCSATASTRVDA